MKISGCGLRQKIAIFLVASLVFPVGGSGTAFGQQANSAQQPSQSPSPATQEQDPNQSAVPAQTPTPSGTETPSTGDEAPAATPEQAGSQPRQTDTPTAPASAPAQQSGQQSQAQQQGSKPAPVGTAVAPYEKGVGIAASRPAGAVIAPAKQRRTRAFFIKVGLLVGAAAAVGSVVALSSASPSQPH